MAFELGKLPPKLPKGIQIFAKRLSVQEYSVRRQVANLANKLLQKRIGKGYDVEEHEHLDLRIYKERDLFDSSGRVIFEIQKNKPYPKQIADRAFDYFSTGIDTLEISGIMGINKRLIDKWAKLFDWDEKIAKISSLAETTRMEDKTQELAKVRDMTEMRHKKATEWFFMEMMAEASTKANSKAEAELKLLKAKAIEISWKTIKSIIEMERTLLGMESGAAIDMIPSNFTYEIVTPEGQVLAKDSGSLESYIPNQDPTEYRPDAGQVQGSKVIVHVPSVAVDAANPHQIKRVNVKEGVVPSEAPKERPRHLYDGSVMIDGGY